VNDTLGVVLKAREDVDAMRAGRVHELLARASARAGGDA
jgi:hypothetical protein